MSLFKITRGAEINLPSKLTDGYAYFCTDTTNFFIDWTNSSNTLVRSKISGKYAEKLRATLDGETVELSVEDILTQLNNKANATHNHDSKYDAKGAAAGVQANVDALAETVSGKVGTLETEMDEIRAASATHATKSELDDISDTLAKLSDDMDVNYDESIIGLSVDGNVITYIKGDGSEHTIITQDTDTTYSLGTDTTTGLTKLYATTGSAEDGTMTQRAIKTELDKKVGVDIDNTQNTLIFTI